MPDAKRVPVSTGPATAGTDPAVSAPTALAPAALARAALAPTAVAPTASDPAPAEPAAEAEPSDGAWTLLDRMFQQDRRSRSAIVDDRASVSYGRLVDRSARLGAGLLRAGITPGDRVFLCLLDTMDWPMAYLGTLLIGGVPVCADTRLDASAYETMLRESGSRLLIVSRSLYPPFDGLLQRIDSLARVVISEAPLADGGDMTVMLSLEPIRDAMPRPANVEACVLGDGVRSLAWFDEVTAEPEKVDAARLEALRVESARLEASRRAAEWEAAERESGARADASAGSAAGVADPREAAGTQAAKAGAAVTAAVEAAATEAANEAAAAEAAFLEAAALEAAVEAAAARAFRIEPGDRCLSTGRLCDPGLLEHMLLPALAAGASLVLIGEDEGPHAVRARLKGRLPEHLEGKSPTLLFTDLPELRRLLADDGLPPVAGLSWRAIVLVDDEPDRDGVVEAVSTRTGLPVFRARPVRVGPDPVSARAEPTEPSTDPGPSSSAS